MGYHIPADHHGSGPSMQGFVNVFEPEEQDAPFPVGSSIIFTPDPKQILRTVLGYNDETPARVLARDPNEPRENKPWLMRVEDCRLAEDVEQDRLKNANDTEAVAQILQGAYCRAFTGKDDVRAWEWAKITEQTRQAWIGLAEMVAQKHLTGLSIAQLVREAGETAKEKGWHRPEFEPDNDIPRWLCLIHSEISEALESHRRNEGEERFAEELADVFIRIADVAYQMDLPLERAILDKLEKNKTREWKHGGKRY